MNSAQLTEESGLRQGRVLGLVWKGLTASVESDLANAGVGVVAGLEGEYSAEHLPIELSNGWPNRIGVDGVSTVDTMVHGEWADCNRYQGGGIGECSQLPCCTYSIEERWSKLIHYCPGIAQLGAGTCGRDVKARSVLSA